MKRTAVALAGVVLVASLATGCDDGPDCIRSHSEIQWIPISNGKTTTLQPMPVTVCDEYEKEKPNG